jgi:hypothetical protein
MADPKKLAHTGWFEVHGWIIQMSRLDFSQGMANNCLSLIPLMEAAGVIVDGSTLHAIPVTTTTWALLERGRVQQIFKGPKPPAPATVVSAAEKAVA